MKDLLAQGGFDLPKTGEIITGTVISLSKSHVMVDLGPAGIGIVYPSQFYDNPERMKELKPGIEISSMLIELENEDGYRELSLRAAQKTTAWQEIREKKENGDIIPTSIVNINKGGLIVEVAGIQGFLPLSQLSAEHYPKVEGGDTSKIVQALQKFKGQEFHVKIIDFSEQEGKLIVSERAIRESAAQEDLLKLRAGDEVDGQITEVTDFGAFVKLTEHLDGLIHSSEIDWKFIEDPKEILHVGETVHAKIINLEGGRVSLSLKALKSNPWDTVLKRYQVGQKVDGKILKVRPNGAFVELEGDIIGLLPMSEFGGANPLDTVEIGTRYSMAVVSIDPQDHKLILTLEKGQDHAETP